jgi:hypothetical protein
MGIGVSSRPAAAFVSAMLKFLLVRGVGSSEKDRIERRGVEFKHIS